MTEPIVDMQNVCKRFAHFELKDVSLSLARGKC